MVLSQQYHFLHYSRQDKNIGFSMNLKSVMDMAKGNYLWTLGDDEILHPQAVARIMAVIQK